MLSENPMSERDLHHQISILQQRIALLQHRAATAAVPPADVQAETFEELQTMLEELHAAEEKLAVMYQVVEAERQRYQELFDFAPDGYLVTDAAGTIREANRAAATMLAVSQTRLRGKPLVAFVPQEERRAFRTRLGQLLQRRDVQEWEMRLQPRQGEAFYAAVTVAEGYDRQRKTLGLRWLLRNISIRKALNASIERLQTQLATEQQRSHSLVQYLPEGVALLAPDWRLIRANPVAHRYLAALTVTTVDESITTLGGQPLERLCMPRLDGLPHEVVVDYPRRMFEIQANRIPAGSEEGCWVLVIKDVTAERDVQQHTAQHERLAAVGRLAAGMAHDFNNLLTVVMGYAELMQERADLPESVQNDLSIIVDQGRRGAHLVRQILGFSQQARNQPWPLDLLSILQEISNVLECTLSESIRIVLESAPGEYMINADVGQFQQLLTNLALNARDAMPTGGELRFHLSHLILAPDEAPPSPAMPPGRWVVLAVSDTGRGMPPEVLHHIFEPFFTTKEKERGAGLGLAQVYGIVQQHQGYITVQSQPGHGTTFTLYLPAMVRPTDAEGEAASQDMPQGQGETVLLVEDTPQVLTLLRLMLERLHYRVLTATDGQEALRVYERHGDAIALVIADLVMPKVGGVALFQALRKRTPGVKVVILTGYLLPKEVHMLRAQGIMEVLPKPPECAVLAQVIHQALAEK
jgi:PAS domain S-box-containing protein